jgi:hypothetical protein
VFFCIAGKLEKRHFSGEVEPHQYKPGKSLHMDVQVMEARSIGGNLYDLTILDESSEKMPGRPIAERRYAGEAAIPIFKSIQRSTGNKIKRIVLENAPEFIGPKSVLGAWMIQKGIDIVPSTRYTSNENNRAEDCN